MSLFTLQVQFKCSVRLRFRERRHTRLLKRGLSGVNPTLEELQGENEACMMALARARLLLTLANCSAMVPSESGEEGQGESDAAVLERVRDAADCVLGEVLQVQPDSNVDLSRVVSRVRCATNVF